MILAADVGGTKSLLALFRGAEGRLQVVHERVFPSQSFPSFQAIVDAFLDEAPRGRVVACAVGVAGPVVAGRSQLVNLPWAVDARVIARRLSLATVGVLNDLEATAWGIPELPARQFANLTPGVRGDGGHAALIAAGTGLGMALLPREGEHLRPAASEGGHQGFAPRTAEQGELLDFLRQRLGGRVSIERVVSGPALGTIYEFLLASGGRRPSAVLTRRLEQDKDRNAVLTEFALGGKDRLARRTLELFVDAYGAAAGDLALVARATGGIYVGGGIAPKILPLLRTGLFVEAFRDKGRLRSLVERVPIRVVLEPRTALIGAAACAARRRPSRGTRRPLAAQRRSAAGARNTGD